MFRNNLIHIFGGHKAIPDRFRIDDNCGPVFALVQAAGGVGTYSGLEAGVLDLFLEEPVQIRAAAVGAGRPGASWFTCIGAEKYMPLELRQYLFPLSISLLLSYNSEIWWFSTLYFLRE